MPYTYEYPRPMVTVDCAVFRVRDGILEVLLVKRGRPPFKGAWAFPGGFVEMEEPLEKAAARELREETGLSGVAMEQFHVFGDPGRDPRGRVIAVGFFGAVARSKSSARAGDDAAKAGWFPARRPPRLAFDHPGILGKAMERLSAAVLFRGFAVRFLPGRFTLDEAAQVYSAVIGGKFLPETAGRLLIDSGLARETRGGMIANSKNTRRA